jgi:ATP-dependent Clp protease adaptor protein ClpS
MTTPIVTPHTRPAGEPSSRLEPRYHLILLDDNDHSYEYVIELLGSVLGYGVEKAYTLACVVDHEGRAIIETADHARVTTHQQLIHAHGADPRIPRCQGSMSAVVEPAS